MSTRISRRSLAALAAAPWAAAQPPAEGDPAAIRELRLPPELRKELEPRVQRAVEEARWLEELPLDGMDPDFVFTPHSERA